MNTAIYIFLIIYGFLICFYGYKLFKFQVAVTGFFVGIFLGYLVFSLLGFVTGIGFILPIICGIIGCVLSFKLYKLTVFLTFSILTYNYLTTMAYNGIFSGDLKFSTKMIFFVVSIIIGIIGVKVNKSMIIILNAIYGSTLVITYLDILVNISPIIVTVVGIFFACYGIYHQFKNTKENDFKV
ncbi:MAG: DUF4203 domain-containing protein [Lachnospirales bacterium]